MNRFLTLKPWTAKEAVTCCFALAVLLAVGPGSGLMTWAGALAGALGALLLRHMALHGWSLLSGTVAQRFTLLGLWLATIAVGGIVASVVGL